MDTAASVLAIEFRGGRETADFSFLTQRLGAGRVRRVDPLTDQIKIRLTIAEQAKVLLNRTSEAPATVVAYCACAALGAHIAAHCNARLVLVDPDAVTAQAVSRDFADLCRTLGHKQPETPLSEVAVTHERWEAALQDARPRLASEQGGDTEAFELVDDLLDRYRGWLRFLDASASAGPATVKTDVTVIVRKPMTDLAALLARPDRVRLHRVEAQSATLDTVEIQELVLAAVL